jgi:hypothetical protein
VRLRGRAHFKPARFAVRLISHSLEAPLWGRCSSATL